MIKKRENRRALVGLVFLILLFVALIGASYTAYGWVGVLFIVGGIPAVAAIQIAIDFWIDQGE